MATYLPGITDYIPQIQPFKPDFNTYNQLMQVKQAQTDLGRKRVGSLYASLFYAPMTGEDNIKRRDDYFKMIEQDIKKISAMDLSLPQNQSAAMKIFDPILEDKDMVYDMSWTKQTNDEYEKGESYRLCDDPKKCGGQFWQEGLTYINLRRKEFADATPAERRQMAAPLYNPLINITEKAFEWTKAQGLVVESVTTDGKYFVTKQNGQQMLIPLTMIYNALYSKDPKVRGMFDTSAYLMRKNYIDQNKERFGGDEKKAEDQWFVDIMQGTVKKQDETLKEVNQINDYVKNKKDYLAQQVNNMSVTDKVKKGDLWDEYEDTEDNDRIITEVKSNYDQLSSVAKSLNLDLDNRELLRQRVDNITSAGLMQQEFMKVAGLYAITHNAVTKMDENQYGVQAQAHAFAMQRLMTKANLDLRNAFLTESGSMGKGLLSLFDFGAEGPASEGKLKDGLPGNITGEYGKGGRDVFESYQKTLSGGMMTSRSARFSMLDQIQRHLNQKIGTGTPMEASYAKSVMKKIFGDSYDIQNNKFVKGSSTVSGFGDLFGQDPSNFDGASLAKYYGNAMGALKSEKTLFKDVVSSQSFNRNLQTEQQAQILKDMSVKTLENNFGMIYKNIDLNTRLNIEDKGAFKLLFKTYDDGRVVLRPKSEYLKMAMARMKSGSQQAKEKSAENYYDEQMGQLKRVYNSGLIQGMRDPIASTFVGRKTDGGMVAGRIEYQSDPRFPFGPGTRGLLSIMNNVKETGAVEKMLWGSNHQTIGDFPDELDYNNLEDNGGARQMFTFLERDMRNNVYKRDAKDAPYAEFDISQVGANRADLNVVTVRPSYEWLKSYAKADQNTKELKAFGRSINDISQNGISIYMNASKSNNMLFNELKKSPYEVLVDSGEEIPINMKNASDLTIQKKGNTTYLSGQIWGYGEDGNGGIVKQNIKNFDNLNFQDINGGVLYKAVLDMATDLNTENSNYVNYGIAPQGTMPMENYIRNAMQSLGAVRPSPEQLAIENFQQNFAQRMRMADAIFNTISSY